MIIAGIDYSYTCPAICVYDTQTPAVFESLKFFNLNKMKKIEGVHGNISCVLIQDWTTDEERYANICLWAESVLVKNNVNEVQLEGYALGSRVGLTFNIAENTSLLKQMMRKHGIPFERPSPGTVKKQFTGKGNAKKEQMIDRFHEIFQGSSLDKQLGVKEYAKPIDDLADAFANMVTHPQLQGVFF